MKIILALSIVLFGFVSRGYAQEDPNCAGAPVPRLVIGEQGRVLPGDSNNVRDPASREGALVGAIPGGAVFDVLDGPVCADGLNWWQVAYEGITGWTGEGAGTDYWIEPYAAPLVEATAAPALEPSPEPVLPVTSFHPPIEPINVLEVGAQVRVLNDDPQAETISLTIRSAPTRSGASVAQAVEGDLLTLIGGPEEADGLRWWQVETALGSQGWVVEGLVNEDRGDTYERTLLPLCIAEGERIAYRMIDYLVTSAPDGSDPCVLEYIDELQWMTFNQTQFEFGNHFLTSPDGEYIIYRSGGTLYRLKRDGSERLRLTSDIYVFWAALSPDGSRIAIATGSGIATMRFDGSGFATLTQGEAIRPWVGWASDSETVVYLEQSRWQDQMGIAIENTFYRINLSEGGLRPLLQTPLEFNLNDSAITDDGTLLAVSGIRHTLIDGMSGTEPVKFYDLGSSSGGVTWIIDLETETTLAELQAGAYRFQWLPDHSALIDVTYLSEEIRLIPVNGDPPVVIEVSGETADGGFLSWESDTALLTMRSYGFDVEPADFAIWRIDVVTGEVQRVSRTEG